MDKIKLHLQIRNVTGTTCGWIRKPKKVYIDGELVTTISVGEKKEIEINKSSKKITIVDVNVLKNKLNQELNIKEDTTDLYMYMGYIGMKAVHLSLYSMNQYNDNLLNKTGEKTVTLNVHRVYDPLQKKEPFKVIVDDDQEYVANNTSDVEFNISPGKHKIFYETNYTMGYSSVDIPKDCTRYQIVMSVVLLGVNVIDSYSIDPNAKSKEKNINCIITRAKRFVCCLASLQVLLDEDIAFNIKNGERKTLKISPGNHIFSVGRVSRMDKKNFEVPENCKAVYIDVDAVMKNGRGTDISIRIEQ